MHKSNESLFLCLFYSVFRCFLLNISSLLNFVVMIFLTFSKISLYLIKTFFFYEETSTSISIKNYFAYNHFIYNHKGLIFCRIFVTNEMFKILFTKRKLIRCYYFISIYIFYQNRAFILLKFEFFNFSIIKFYNFFIHFYIWF